MAPRKLSDSDKQEITQIYCQPGETTSTLAERFGVSSSTVSRVLKQTLSDDDYKNLMQWKRGGERGSLELSFAVQAPEEKSPATKTEEADHIQSTAEDAVEETSSESSPTSEKNTVRRSRRRSTAQQASDEESSEAADQMSESEISEHQEIALTKAEADRNSKRVIKKSDRINNDEIADSDVAAWVSEGLKAENDYDADDDDEEDWDDEEWDDETDEDDDDEIIPPTPRQEEVAILSLDDFVVKKPCYLVVDRLAELITCPLKEFAELGLIPAEEEQARTLPVFDNHRVARRFARRNQRIIKVPNGLMLNKTQEYLQAKGITRLLFDGQVYALN